MKKTLSTITLAAVLTFGTTVASADGLIIGGRTANTENTCTQVEKDGLIIGGIIDIIYQFTGILVYDRSEPCAEQSRDGLLISD